MPPDKTIPPAVAQHDATKRLEKLHEDAKNNAQKLNELSGNYRNTLVSIHDKIIVISIGSASLLLTFLGVLFGADKNTSALQFKYLIVSVICFLIVPVFLFISRWMLSLFVFSLGHKYYMESLIAVHEGEIKLLKLGNTIINPDYAQMSAEQIKGEIAKLENRIKDIKKELNKTNKKEKTNNDWQKRLAIIAYIILGLAYIFSLLFFLDVIDLMNAVKS